MKPFEIITVATHDEGTYHQLIQNPYYSNIIVWDTENIGKVL